MLCTVFAPVETGAFLDVNTFEARARGGGGTFQVLRQVDDVVVGTSLTQCAVMVLENFDGAANARPEHVS